jgi:glutamyl-tRNA synthetase
MSLSDHAGEVGQASSLSAEKVEPDSNLSSLLAENLVPTESPTHRPTETPSSPSRGRLAPSPTGLLHLGHARTFWTAQMRARAAGGTLVLRNEDLDRARCRPEFVRAMLEDLRWFGFAWTEGPDCGGPFAPYQQSGRLEFYRAALETLRAGGFIYPCTCSRKDIQAAARAPHAVDDEEPLYPGTCRARTVSAAPVQKFSWRFRVPDHEVVAFTDGRLGAQAFVAGKDFGDFIVWRHDGVPAYQLACVVDDAAMRITEVVRGADLLVSTARQLLLYRALGLTPPRFYHCPLLLDDTGQRLAKRHDALSLRTLREQGRVPEEFHRLWASEQG